MMTSFLMQGHGQESDYVPASGQITGILKQMLVTLKQSLEDSQKSFAEDTAFLKDMAKACKTKEAEWAARQQVRAEELVAIGDTIKLLNDDDALELFKKALPAASLMQLKTTTRATKGRALAALQAAGQGDVRINLIALALKGKKVSFAKVLVMIDDMVALLGKEQNDDNDKKEYCEMSIDKTEDDLKALELR